MADKNALVRGLIGGILYDLMIKSNVYQIKVDENTTLADKLQEVVTALNGKVKTSDIVNDLTTGGLSVPLSAEMGKHLKYMIDNLPTGGGGEVPTHLSKFVNDAGFITNAVADLVNYYRKNETYSREEVDTKISAIPKFTVSVVTELPTADISETTIYLVPGGNGTDLYTEFIRADGKWEILGSQKLDLTGYATEEFVLRKISEAELGGGEVDLSQYALKTELPTKVSQLENDEGYIKEHQDISGLLPRTELDNAINEALAQAKASGAFDGYNPVRGTDYWTPDDIAEIKSYVDEAILGGAW